ncbi:MAG: HNH nuclease family protein [Magnetococcales bacterium]|nr:HNH nuclease family protein [Magnetococcales bacterium]
MVGSSNKPLRPKAEKINPDRVHDMIAAARKASEERAAGYRERSLAIHPWVCARCARTFVRENLTELTVHHKDFNHDNNPDDGSNWENLCLYCHDNEHARYEEHQASTTKKTASMPLEPSATYNPFANLKELLERKST